MGERMVVNGGSRWTEIETDFGEDETVNFGKRTEFASSDSLYHLQTLATIRKTNAEENVGGNVKNGNVCLSGSFLFSSGVARVGVGDGEL